MLLHLGRVCSGFVQVIYPFSNSTENSGLVVIVVTVLLMVAFPPFLLNKTFGILSHRIKRFAIPCPIAVTVLFQFLITFGIAFLAPLRKSVSLYI